MFAGSTVWWKIMNVGSIINVDLLWEQRERQFIKRKDNAT